MKGNVGKIKEGNGREGKGKEVKGGGKKRKERKGRKGREVNLTQMTFNEMKFSKE